MKWQKVSSMRCSVARSLSIVGDRWTMLIVRNAFLGTRRFDHFQSGLGVTRHVLASRLGRLVKAGVLKKVPYQESPTRYEYRLTEQGRDLYPVLLSLTAWGDKWLDRGHGPPLEYHHSKCNKKTQPMFVCSECAAPLDPREVRPMAGPGAA